MSDRVLIPLPDGRWLLISAETFADALRSGAEAMGARAVSSAVDTEPALTAEQLGAAMNLPASWLEAAGRDGRIPSIQAGRWRRFQRSAVEAALSSERRPGGTNPRAGFTTQLRKSKRGNGDSHTATARTAT